MVAVQHPDPRRNRARGGTDPLATYLDEIGAVPLLDAERERELAALIAAGKQAARRLERADLDDIERRALQRRVRAGETAFNQFVEANLRLVVSAAKRYQSTGVPLLDLIQDGNLGLMRAVDKFDHTKGFRFSTYAMWWIRQSISRGLAASRTSVRLPTRANDDLVRLRAAVNEETGEQISWQAVGERSSLDAERVAELAPLLSDPVSWSTPVGDGNAELGDFVSDEAADDPLDSVSHQLRPHEVDRLLAPLDDRERIIIEMRYGFDGGEGARTNEIGRRLGISRERVRQLERRAIAKLTHPSRPPIRELALGC